MKFLCLVFLLVALLVPETSIAAAAGDTGLVADILAEFKSIFDEVATVAKKYALTLFAYAATLEIAFLGIRAALGQAEIGETIKNFIFAVLTAGFFLAVINNYESWTQSIVSGLGSIAGEMTSVSDGIDNSFKLGLKLCAQIWDQVSMTSPVVSVGYALASLVVLVVFCLITALVILVRCEAYIAMGVACILIGLGPSQFFRDYAVNVLKYIFSVAFKLLTMQVVIGVGYTFINKIDLTSSPDMSVIFTAIGVSIVLLALTKVLPDTVAGIINGSHIGGSGLTNAIRSVALGTMMAAGMAAATAKNVNYAHKAASAQGAQGFLGHAGSMASNLYSAWRQSAHGKEGTSMGNALRERIAASEAPSMPSMSSMSSSLLSSGSGGSSSGSSGSVSSMSGGSSGGGGMVSGSASGGASAASGSSGASNLSARIGAMTGATLAGATLGGAASNLSGGVSGSFSGGGSSVVRGGASAASGDASSPGQTKISGKIQDN